MKPGQRCTRGAHVDGFHEFSEERDKDYRIRLAIGKFPGVRCEHVEPKTKEKQ